MDSIPPGLLNGVGVVAVVLLVGWLVWSGRLVPRRTYEDVLHDRDEWRTESRIKDAQLAEKDTQLEHLGEVGRTVAAIMTAVQHQARAVPSRPTEEAT
jgi:hypothetical protein